MELKVIHLLYPVQFLLKIRITDKMMKLFEDGMKLMKLCRTQLDEVENRITTLVKENDEFSEKPGIKQS